MTRLLTILCVAAALAAFGGEYTIDLPEGGVNGRIAAIELSGEVLRNLGGHTAWLRLYDSSGTIVPWACEQATVKTTRRGYATTPLQIDFVRKTDDGALEITFHAAPDTELADEAYLVFKTENRDFGQNVKIFGKEAGGEERPLMIHGRGYIFDSSANIDARELSVKFSPGQCREFRLLLSDADLERTRPERSVSVTKDGKSGATINEKTTVIVQPFNIKGLELQSIKENVEFLQHQHQHISVPFEKVSTDNGKSIYSVKPDVFPFGRLVFDFQEENFSRNFTVKKMLKDGHEGKVANGVVSRRNGSANSMQGTFWNVDEADTLQITIEDNDNPPLTLKNVFLEIPLYRLKFFAKPEQFPMRLTATPNSKAPVYDIASLLALGDKEHNEMNTSIIRPEKFSGEPISAVVTAKESRGVPRMVLYIAIGIAVAVMAAALAATLKKAKVE